MRALAAVVLLSSYALADEPAPELAVLHHFPGVDLLESHNESRYAHSGPPAKVHQAFLNFEVRDARAHRITVEKVAIVVDHCRAPKHAASDLVPRTVGAHALYTWDSADPIAKGKASVRTPAGKPRRYAVKVAFDGYETYAACGLALQLVVDKVPKRIELPFHLRRMEPLRRR